MNLLIYKPTVNRGPLKKQSFQGRRGDSQRKVGPRRLQTGAWPRTAARPASIFSHHTNTHTAINQYSRVCLCRCCGPLFAAHLWPPPLGSPLCPAPTLVASSPRQPREENGEFSQQPEKAAAATAADDLVRHTCTFLGRERKSERGAARGPGNNQPLAVRPKNLNNRLATASSVASERQKHTQGDRRIRYLSVGPCRARS
jgi:hypothetical protein